MKRKIPLLISLVLNFSAWTYGQEAVISGQVSLDSAWSRKVYVSRIADFNLMFTASDALIIAEGDIGRTGNFKVRFPVTANESLYRLHFVRKNDPASTIIIGGRNENHVFFIAKESDRIYFQSGKNPTAIQQANVSGSRANRELDALFEVVNNNTLDRKSIKSLLIINAEKSTSELVGLLALHNTLGPNSLQKARVRDILKHFKKENPYGARIFQEYQIAYNWTLTLLEAILLIVIALLIGYYLYKKSVHSKVYQVLSQREIYIVKLILSDKSNKEIASILNIELSTVKTHVNNIYAKLKIGNRKELIRYKYLINKTDRQQ